MNKDIYKIKTADNYTDEEIVNILNRTESQKEYDTAIDRLYILRGDGKRRSKSDNVRTQQQMQRDQKKSCDGLTLTICPLRPSIKFLNNFVFDASLGGWV